MKLSTIGTSVFASLLLVFLTAPVGDAADSVTSSVLLRSCEAALGDDEDAKGLGMFCLGYVGGLADTYAVVQGVVPEEHRKELMCIPSTVDAEEMVRVIVKYLKDHPKLEAEPARVTAAVALSKAYPCPTK